MTPRRSSFRRYSIIDISGAEERLHRLKGSAAPSIPVMAAAHGEVFAKLRRPMCEWGSKALRIFSGPARSHLIDSDIGGLGDCSPALDLLADQRIELQWRRRFRADTARSDLFSEFWGRHHAADIGGDRLDHGW